MQNTTILQADEIARTLERLASQIIEKHGECNEVMFVGIQRRGADIALRLRDLLTKRLQKEVPLGTLNINLYRDDWTSLSTNPNIGQSNIPQDVDNMTIILVDDVLFTGRTIRAALEALLDYGRPSCVELLVLVDRGHRELPIQANYIGRTVNTGRQEHVDVLLQEYDGQDTVLLKSNE